LPNLIRWHYPSNLTSLWQDSARTTPATQESDPVGACDDLSGNGRHFLQATSTKRFTLDLSYTGAYHAIYPDNSDDTLTDTTFNEAANEIWYIVAAIQREGSAGIGQNIFSTTQRLVFEQGNNNQYEQYAGSTLSSGITVPVSRTIKLIKTTWAGASSLVRINSTNGSTGNAGSGAGTNQSIGIGGGQPKCSLRYLEIVCVSSITAANNTLLVDYLNRLGPA